MLDAAGAIPAQRLDELLLKYPYHRRVFLLPPWQAIYANAAERNQTFAEAIRGYEVLGAWYRRCKYEVVDVPQASVAERCDYVLRSLGETSA